MPTSSEDTVLHSRFLQKKQIEETTLVRGDNVESFGSLFNSFPFDSGDIRVDIFQVVATSVVCFDCTCLVWWLRTSTWVESVISLPLTGGICCGCNQQVPLASLLTL